MALSLALILIAGINFSLLIPVNKIAGDAGFPNFAYVFWYALGAGLILLVPAMIRRELPQLTWPHLRLYFVSAALGFAFPFALLAFVATKLPSGVTVLLLTLTPVFTYALAVIFRLDRFRVISAAGLLTAIAGVLLIVIPGESLPAPSMAVWFVIALLIPFGFGALNVFVERFRPPESSSLGLAIGNLFAGALLLIPFLPATGQLYLFPGPDLDGDLSLVAAVVINAIMWPMFYIIVRRAGASLFSIMNIIGVVGGIGWGILFFDETHSAYVWGAAGLMLAAFVMMVIGSIQSRRQQDPLHPPTVDLRGKSTRTTDQGSSNSSTWRENSRPVVGALALQLAQQGGPLGAAVVVIVGGGAHLVLDHRDPLRVHFEHALTGAGRTLWCVGHPYRRSARRTRLATALENHVLSILPYCG